jgi:hypothetical protein
MKKKNLNLLIIMFMLVAGSAGANGNSCLPGKTDEKVLLFTDRSIYIVGEQVNFFASLFNDNETDNPSQSNILYCELITPDGKKIASDKYLISELSAKGCVNIPGDILTGTYYLRAYTKQMRNLGPASYGYMQIRIINPGKSEVLATDNNQDIPAQQLIPAEPSEANEMLLVTVDKNAYTPRDTINLSVQAINGSIGKIKSLCLSVVPESTKSSVSFLPKLKEPIKAEADYYPETRGLSLTGKLTETSSAMPVMDKKINLSIVGDGRDFFAVRTDSSGRFFFALPDYYGSRDLFLCAEKIPGKEVKIWVDNDFCSTPFRLAPPAFDLSEQESRSAQNMALNVQINSHFNADTLGEIQKTKNYQAFYGEPTTILYLDKYIQLPTLDEYFNELPYQVKVRKHKGESKFVVLGATDLSFYDPLVLVDWVAVDEPSKILVVSPQNISRIEVVNHTYVKGDQTYGGIISIISKKGDFAGIDLPSTGIFVNYRFLSEDRCKENVYDKIAVHPDVRNTVLWKPDIKMHSSDYEKAGTKATKSRKTAITAQNSEPENIVFTAPDTFGRYSIVLEGVTTSGEIFSVTRAFEVNK